MVDRKPRALVVTDPAGWRRIIFDRPLFVRSQRMDGSFVGYGAAIDLKKDTLTLTKPDDKKWRAGFTFRRIGADRLIIDGRMDNHTMHMGLVLVDRSTFVLVSRGFHWIQDYPFNR